MTEAPEASGDFVQSLARGLAVIRAFDAEHPELSLSDVARRAGIPRAAARRFLRTLETLGYVRANGDGTARSFALTPHVLELGFSYLSALTLPELVQPHLETLSRAVDESVSAAVLDGTDIVYVARVPTRRIMTVGINLGTRFPAFATSMGRVHLAALDESRLEEYFSVARLTAITAKTVHDRNSLIAVLERVREQGYALVDEELESGLRSIAVPVRDRAGRVVVAINASAQTSGVTVASIISDYLPRLRQAAEAIERDLASAKPLTELMLRR